MSSDLAAGLAHHWNRAHTEHAEAADFWPLLRMLADEGLVTGDERSLTTIQLGPFRLAVTPYQAATRDFLDVLLPGVVVGAADGDPLHGVVAGSLAAATQCFVAALRHGVVFGRSPVDRLRWSILIFVKEHRPSLGEVVEAHDEGAEAAVAWLLDHSLIAETSDGALESLV